MPSSLMAVPYQRLPQIGARTDQALGDGFQASFETEFNQLHQPDGRDRYLAPDRAATACDRHGRPAVSRRPAGR